MRFRHALMLAALIAVIPVLPVLAPAARADERPMLLAQAPAGEETTQPGGTESLSPETPAGEQTTDPGGTEAQIDSPDDSRQLAHQPRDDTLASRDIFTPVSGEPAATSSSFWSYVIYGVVALVILGIVLRRRAT